MSSAGDREWRMAGFCRLAVSPPTTANDFGERERKREKMERNNCFGRMIRSRLFLSLKEKKG